MLNKKTLKVIQSLNSISNKVIFDYPLTCIRDGKTVQAYLDMSKLGEDEFESFGIYSLSDLLSAVSLIENPEITLNSKTLKIFNNKSSVTYNTSSIELLEEDCGSDYSLIQRVKSNTKIGEFELSSNDFKDIKIASNALKDLPDLHISNSKSGISLKISGKEKNSNTYETIVDGKSEEDFNLIANLNFLKKIPTGNYLVEIYKSQKGDSRILLFTSKDIESLEILLAIKNKG